jgi:hypothetical protein
MTTDDIVGISDYQQKYYYLQPERAAPYRLTVLSTIFLYREIMINIYFATLPVTRP